MILASIFLRVGVGEAFVRFYFDDEDVAAPRPHRALGDRDGGVDDDARVARSRSSFAGPLSHLLLGSTTRC